MPEDANHHPDSGLACLVLLLRFNGVAAEVEQISHRLGGAAVDMSEIVRCARGFGLKVRIVAKNWSRLAASALPAIAMRRDGTFLILGRIVDDKALVQDPVRGRPQLIERAELEAAWSGKLIVMTRRASLAELARRFDISWFLQAMHKYRGLLTEVLVASFFLQMFALVSPLFFQVVIDKVLVHRGLTTLDVLVGLA